MGGDEASAGVVILVFSTPSRSTTTSCITPSRSPASPAAATLAAQNGEPCTTDMTGGACPAAARAAASWNVASRDATSRKVASRSHLSHSWHNCYDRRCLHCPLSHCGLSLPSWHDCYDRRCSRCPLSRRGLSCSRPGLSPRCIMPSWHDCYDRRGLRCPLLSRRHLLQCGLVIPPLGLLARMI